MFKRALSLILVLLLCVTFASCASPGNHSSGAQYIGMTYEEFLQVVPKDELFSYLGYLFFIDDQGNPCVAFIDEQPGATGTITEYQSYNRKNIDISSDSFEKITAGMSIYDVVAQVGLPTDTATFGMATLVFPAESGEYVIYWDLTPSPIAVESVIFREAD